MRTLTRLFFIAWIIPTGVSAGLPDFKQAEPRNELVIVDAAVADLVPLLRETRPGTEIAVLDAGSDAVRQIGQLLSARQGVDAIHLFSHGSDGQINFSAGTLSQATLPGYSDAFGAWREALSDDADLLIYGCRTAASREGRAFIAALALATSADVAASDDWTGSPGLGGDWELEQKSGNIETRASAVPGYSGVLAEFTEAFDSDPTGGATVTGFTISGDGKTFVFGQGGTGEDVNFEWELAYSDIIINSSVGNTSTLDTFTITSTVGEFIAHSIDIDPYYTEPGGMSITIRAFDSSDAEVFNQSIIDQTDTVNFTPINFGGVVVSRIEISSVDFYGAKIDNFSADPVVNTAPTQAVNTGSSVDEGASDTVSAAELDFNDDTSTDTAITYTVTADVAHGQLLLSGTAIALNSTFTQDDINNGRLTYAHDGSETTADSFGFKVGDGDGAETTGQVFDFVVNPVNDSPAVAANTGSSLNEGATNTIVAAELDFNDDTSPDTAITYTVTAGVSHGQLLLNGTAVGVNGTFSQDDINNSLLVYIHDGSETTGDSFAFTVSDGDGGETAGQVFNFAVIPVNDSPAVAANTGSSLSEGATDTIAATELDFDDDTSPDTSITYTVTAGVSHGQLLRNGTAVGVNDTFTQDDINNGLLSYEHDGSESTGDSFGFRVIDGDGGETAGLVFNFTIAPINDPPTASAAAVATAEDTPYAFSSADFQFIDVDGGSLKAVELTTAPSAGSLSLNGGAVSAPSVVPVADIEGGKLVFTPDLNGNGEGYSSFTFRVSDGEAFSAVAYSMTVDVTAVNDAPTGIILSSTSIADSAASAGAVLGTASAADVDTGDTHSYSLVAGDGSNDVDNGRFTFSGSDLVLSQDLADGTYFIYIRTTDAATASYDQAITVNVSGEVVDGDRDKDGMPDDWEQANGLDPDNPDDALEDLDGDGVSNLDEYLAASDPQSDEQAPVVVAPADIVTDATGLFTKVDLGEATASDAKDGEIATVTSDAPERFAPGRYTITWSASDAAGNTGTAQQQVEVLPLVGVAPDQVTGEGSAVVVRVVLNGEAPTYPVSVPYTVSGTANSSDHNLANGTLTLHRGLEGVISFTTVDDGLGGEADETVTVTLGEPTGAALGRPVVHTVTIREGNLAPKVGIAADQGGIIGATVAADGGPVVIRAAVDDPNGTDSHAFDWSGTDPRLVDSDSAADTLTFDPGTLEPGAYEVRISITDDAAAPAAASTSGIVRVIASAPTLTSDDSDGDGLSDLVEGWGDADRDNIVDYMDGSTASNVLQERAGNSSAFLIESLPATDLSLGTVAFGSGLNQAGVSVSELPEDRPANVGGVFDFRLTGIAAGASTDVVIPQAQSIPENPFYRTWSEAAGWADFIEDGANALASAPGAKGYCPPPGDSAYSAGLTPGHWCVQVSVQNGGPNDGDGTANGSVAMLGGVAGTVRHGGGGGATHWWALLALLGLIFRVRRVA